MIAPDLRPLARPIASLREDPQNARKHDKRNLAALATSLGEFGQRKPVVALADGTVIAGNGTLAAAKSLGWTEIAVATFEDEEKAKAYAIADNRAGELASWDDDILAAALIGAGLAWLSLADEVLVVGTVTAGMRAEIATAEALGIPIRYAAPPATPRARESRGLVEWLRGLVPGAWEDRAVLAAIALVILGFLLCPGCVGTSDCTTCSACRTR